MFEDDKLAEMGTDPLKWAQELGRKEEGLVRDSFTAQDLMLPWFANAIEAGVKSGFDLGVRRGEAALMERGFARLLAGVFPAATGGELRWEIAAEIARDIVAALHQHGPHGSGEVDVPYISPFEDEDEVVSRAEPEPVEGGERIVLHAEREGRVIIELPMAWGIVGELLGLLRRLGFEFEGRT